MPTLSFSAPMQLSRKIRAAARRRGVPVSRFIKEAAEREASSDRLAVGVAVPNETTAAAIREPVAGLPKYRAIDDAWRSLIYSLPPGPAVFHRVGSHSELFRK